MILSNECWLKGQCPKALNPHINAPCLQEDIFCVKLFKLDYLYNAAKVSLKQREHINLRLDANRVDEVPFQHLAEIQNGIENFVESGKNLYLYSSTTGNGKTAWALRLLQSYFNKIWFKTDLCCRGLFINTSRLLLAIKDSYSDFNDYASYIKENVTGADLVVWDEIGVRDLSVHDHEQLLNFINTRIDCGRSNIYTSNLLPTDLRERVGERLFSRIINYSDCVELRGCDKRSIFK